MQLFRRALMVRLPQGHLRSLDRVLMLTVMIHDLTFLTPQTILFEVLNSHTL